MISVVFFCRSLVFSCSDSVNVLQNDQTGFFNEKFMQAAVAIRINHMAIFRFLGICEARGSIVGTLGVLKTHQNSVPRYDVMITCTSKDTCNHQVIIVDGSTRNLALKPVEVGIVKTSHDLKRRVSTTIPGFRRWVTGYCKVTEAKAFRAS